MSNNIIFNKKLEEYNKKYHNGRYKLLKYTKKEVEQYDKYANQTLKTKNHLLKGRRWALIGDTYYEIPKAPRALWFRNLNAGVKAATCALVGGAVAGGAGYGIYVAVANGKQPVKPDPGPQPGPEPEPVVEREVVIDSSMASDLKISNKQKTSEGIKCTIDKIDQSAEVNAIVEIKIGESELQSSDYSFDTETKELTIFNSALEAHQGKITIKPSYSHSVTEQVFTEQINTATEEAQTQCGSFCQQTQSGTSMVNGNGEQIEFYDLRYAIVNGIWEVTVNAPSISSERTLLAGGDYSDVMGILVTRLMNDYEGRVSFRENNPEGLIITAFSAQNDIAEKYIFNNSGYLVYCYKNDFAGHIIEFGVEYSETTTQILNENSYTLMTFAETAPGETSNSGNSTQLEQETPESIEIPESVLHIGGEGGEQNQDIVTSIANDAYKVNDIQHPYTFTTVNIPCTVKTIGNSAFENNTQIEEINFELNNSQLETIGEKAFSCCNSLTSVHIPSKVTTIGDGAFKFGSYEEGKGIKTVYIDSSTVANFDPTTASKTYLYTSSPKVYVKESIRLDDDSYIKQYFEQKETVDGYVIYEKIASADYFKFTKLTSAKTPSVKVEFNDEGQMNVPTTLVIPSTIDGTVFSESKQNTYKVTEIVSNGFDADKHSRCANIEYIQLGNNVTNIGSSAFAKLTKLKSINIPTSVTNIQTYAFDGCEDTDFSVTFEDQTSDWDVGDETTISHTDLQNAKTAAGYLNNEYKNKNWTKKIEPITEYLTFEEIGTTGTYEVSAVTDKSVFIPAEVTIPEKYNGGDVVKVKAGGFKDKTNITSVTLPKTIKEIGANAFSGCTFLTQESSAGVIFDSECQTGWKQIGEKYTSTLDVSNPKYNANYFTDAGDDSWRATGIVRTDSGNTINLVYSQKGFSQDVSSTKFEAGQTWEIVGEYPAEVESPVAITSMSFVGKDGTTLLDLSAYIKTFSCTYTNSEGKTMDLNPQYKSGDKKIIYFNDNSGSPTSYNNGKITMTITFVDIFPKDDPIHNIQFYTPQA